MQSVTHDGRETAYRQTEFGDGPGVLYIHGAGGTHQVWTHQYTDTDTDGPTAAALDLSGHGDSDDVDVPAGPETLDAYADDVVAVCEATGATVLCGNSMGGAIALWVALERDVTLDGLVLCDTGAKLAVAEAFSETLQADFDAAVELLHDPGTLFYDPADDLLELSKTGLRETGQAVTIRDFETCDVFDVRDRLDEIDVPALAIYGEHDPLTPPSYHEYLAEQLSACSLAELEDAAHMPMLERPSAFNERVRSFVDSHCRP